MSDKTPLLDAGNAPAPFVSGAVVSQPGPPPYMPAPPQGTVQINCAVCHHPYPVVNSSVGTCPQCGEKTPLGPPPPGKQYTRCMCNALLVHSVTAGAVTCPRPHCRRTTILGPPPPGKARGTCPHCQKLIQWNVRVRGIVRCPTCGGRAVVERGWLRLRIMRFLIVGLLLLTIGVVVTVLTYDEASDNGGIYIVAWGPIAVGIIDLIVAFFLFIRAATTPDVNPDPTSTV
mmetsp:Transcript_10915/g.34778  ORF Transcript_10915/g.34778 Transcript_10915/m.34778 type:complete len:230 (-) Transcript_10915:151-840(-)